MTNSSLVQTEGAGGASLPGTGAGPSSIPWPDGPHYFDLVGSDGASAWIRYRIWSADWHTHTLNELAGPSRSFDRQVGIEMAIDGALNNLSGAFDAAVALLIRTAEETLEVKEDAQIPHFRYSWPKARDLLKKVAIGTTPQSTAYEIVWRVILDMENAMDGETEPNPQGWLAQLRRLRNQVAHQDSLARHHSGTTSNVGGLTFDGRHVDASEFLAANCDAVHDLVEQMLRLAISLGAPEISTVWNRPRWTSAT